jgi:hypothetical protein
MEASIEKKLALKQIKLVLERFHPGQTNELYTFISATVYRSLVWRQFTYESWRPRGSTRISDLSVIERRIRTVAIGKSCSERLDFLLLKCAVDEIEQCMRAIVSEREFDCKLFSYELFDCLYWQRLLIVVSDKSDACITLSSPEDEVIHARNLQWMHFE